MWHGLHQLGGWLTASGVFQLSAPAFKIAASNGTDRWIGHPCFPCPFVPRRPQPRQPRICLQKCRSTSSRLKRGSCLTSLRGRSIPRKKFSFASWCVESQSIIIFIWAKDHPIERMIDYRSLITKVYIFHHKWWWAFIFIFYSFFSPIRYLMPPTP